MINGELLDSSVSIKIKNNSGLELNVDGSVLSYSISVDTDHVDTTSFGDHFRSMMPVSNSVRLDISINVRSLDQNIVNEIAKHNIETADTISRLLRKIDK